MWLLIEVNEPQDVGKNEKNRYLVKDEIARKLIQEPTSTLDNNPVTRVHPATL